MRPRCCSAVLRCALLAFLCAGCYLDASAAAIWRRTTSGFWGDPNNWSSPTPPSLATGGAHITNLATKTVTVDALTSLTNLFINGLNVWAPANTTNTLLLADVG